MALPWRTFAASQTLIQLLTGSKISTTDIGTLYNLAYREIIEGHQWSARLAEGVINTDAEYSTGTVDLTNGSATIMGTGTVFTAAMVGRFIRLNDADFFHKIATRVSNTEITIEKAWNGDTALNQSFVIFQYIYPVDTTAGEVGEVLWPNEQYHFEERPLNWVTIRDAPRRANGDLPRVWVPHGLSATGQYLIEFWPRFSSASHVRVPYRKRVDDLTGTAQPIIQSDVVEALALSYCFSHMYTKSGDPAYERQESLWEKRYAARLERALIADQNRHALPRSVQPETTLAFDHEFYVSHDV